MPPRVGDHLLVRKVSEGTCTGQIFLGVKSQLWVSSLQTVHPCDAPCITGEKCYPRWILQINREVGNERKPKNQDSTCVLQCLFSHLYQKSNMILWSIRTFWYKGSAENKKKRHVREKRYISQKQQPKNTSLIFQKSLDMM